MTGKLTTIMLRGNLLFAPFRKRQPVAPALVGSRLLRRLLIPGLIVLLTACKQPGVVGYSSRPISDEQLHGLMIERINTLQRSIEVLVYEQNRTQSELDQTRRRRTADIAAAAMALRDSLGEVVTLEPSLGLSGENSSVFLALAQRLRDDSEALAELATGNRVGSLMDAVTRLQESCVSCHSLYRGN